jgi:hypothetical protein
MDLGGTLAGVSETPPPQLSVSSGSALLDAVREIERYVADAGWDQPARLFALADTAALLVREPELAAAMGLRADGSAALTPVEQEALAADRPLEDVLATMMWPDDVVGCALAVERVVLPPEAETSLPADPDDLAATVATHEARQDVRMVVAVLRDGTRECAVRLRSHDEEQAVLTGPDLVPALADALLVTFD